MGLNNNINSAKYQLRALLMVVQGNKSDTVPSSVQVKHYSVLPKSNVNMNIYIYIFVYY